MRGVSFTILRASERSARSWLYTTVSRGFLAVFIARLMLVSFSVSASSMMSFCCWFTAFFLASGMLALCMEVALAAVKKVPSMLQSVRAAYDIDTVDFDPGIDCSGYYGEHGEWCDTPSMTRQADAEDCDINVMMAKYQATGVEPRVNPRSPQWGDFSSVLGFQDALNVVRQSEADFMLLPAEVRDRFGNNPAGMLEFLADEKNRDEAERLGLVIPARPDPEPMAVRVVPEPSEGRGESSPPKGSKEPAPGA